MFFLQKELDRIAVPAQHLLRVQRSLNRAQIALPGFPAQETSAYLVAFRTGKGVRVVAGLYLHSSRRLAVYLHDEGEIPEAKLERVLDSGIAFAESMGFMLSDLDIQSRSPEERRAQWEALPLYTGGEKDHPVQAAAAQAKKTSPSEDPSPSESPTEAAIPHDESSSRSRSGIPLEERLAALDENRPPLSLSRGRQKPSEAEVAGRRKKLRENLGRFLASL